MVSVPDLPYLLIILGVLVVVGIVLSTALGKRLLGQLRIQTGKLWIELKQLAKQPTKMLMLFGGAGFSKVMAIVMLWQSLNAFHVTGIPFAQLGAMYITATTVAGAVPTPGGVGAIEAALTAGLVSLGVEPAVAAAIVVFFRVISYWLPVLPCWIAYRHVEKNDLLIDDVLINGCGTPGPRTRPSCATRRCSGSTRPDRRDGRCR